MAKLPLTSKKSNLACLCVTAQLNNLGCTRKCFWHLLFSESRQQPEQFGLCLLYLCTQENSSVRACAGPTPGTPYTLHHCHQRRTWSLQTILHFLQRLVGCVADCHWQWPERELPPRAFQMEAGCHEGNSLSKSSSWAVIQARRLLEARVYSWCWIQPKLESRFQPVFTYMLYSESCLPQKEDSWPANITSYSKLRGQKTP